MNPSSIMGVNTGTSDHAMDRKMTSSYRNLFFVSIIHFIIMYAVMFTMVDRAASIYLNVNNLYMTGMMLAPMVLLMPLTMAMMYPNKKLNNLIYISAIGVFAAFYIFMRSQTFVGDKQFLRSMIPHHSGAILMCSQAAITDPEIKKLCEDIVVGQKREVEQMKAILNRM